MRHLKYRILLFLFLPLQIVLPNKTSTIIFGFSGSLSGHFGTYGIMITRGILAAFQARNNAGGINGHHLVLSCHDDGGNTEQTIKNINAMIEQKNISRFIGIMNIKGALHFLDLIKQQQLALLFPWGSDAALCDPALRFCINGLGNLYPQTAKLVDALAKQKVHKVAIFHADDAFSTKAAQMCTTQLKNQHIEPALVTNYNRHTLNINRSTASIIASDPKVVICIGTGLPIATLINQLFQKCFYGTKFLGIDSTFLVPHILQDKGIDFAYAAPVPNPTQSTIQLAKEYQHDLKQSFPDEPYSPLSFAYYVSARAIIKALEKSPDLSNEQLINTIEEFQNVDLLGFPLNFNPKNRYLFGEQVWIHSS